MGIKNKRNLRNGKMERRDRHLKYVSTYTCSLRDK